jgi:hypothetical protein
VLLLVPKIATSEPQIQHEEGPGKKGARQHGEERERVGKNYDLQNSSNYMRNS